ncbi:hypothetical protein M405DRAFT_401299 [Rhizopogon salebrosus TDB-379]|nr:hypothetical protein M405DRAFT_401299 [Rhizopogon salebrosus TDB-379]
MWTQQRTISSVIISATALGILFYVATILISVLHPDSPFQTAGSVIVGAISRKIPKAFSDAFSCALLIASSNMYSKYRRRRFKLASTPNIVFDKSSPIRWILETSTNPEVVEAAAAMVTLVQWSPKIDASAAYGRLIDNLAMCVGRPELFVTCGKAMAHLRVQSAVNGSPNLRKECESWSSWVDKSRFIRDAFTDARHAWDQLKNLGREDDRLMLQANARTALRTVIVHGREFCVSRPEEEYLIWEGDLRWHHADGHTPSCEEFDWLIDYLVDRVPDETDDKTEALKN